LDLFFPNSGRGIEIKFRDAPRMSRSMRIAMEDLKLKQLLEVYPGTREYALAEILRAPGDRLRESRRGMMGGD
jgi:hypothetical protein